MFVQKWEAIFQMIYSVTYSEKYLPPYQHLNQSKRE